MSSLDEKKEIVRIFDQATKDFTYQKAITKIEKILVKHPELEDDRTFSKLGFLYDHSAIFPKKNKQLRKKCESKAFDFYHRALKYDSESVSAIWGIGRIWWHRRDKRALSYARKAATIATKKDPKMFPMFMNLAVVYEDLGNTKRAEYWYRRVIDNDPNSWGTIFGLVNLYYSHPFPNKKKKIIQLLPNLLRLYKKEFKKIGGTKFGEKTKKKLDEIVKFVDKNK